MPRKKFTVNTIAESATDSIPNDSVDAALGVDVSAPAAAPAQEGDHVVYVLYNRANAATYVGYSVDPVRRLRQHNGELVGGASATRSLRARGVLWLHLCIVTTPAFDKCSALSFEWHAKHPPGRGKRGRAGGVEGRLHALAAAIEHAKFAAAPHFTVRVCTEHLGAARAALAHCGPRVRIEALDPPVAL